MDKHQQLKLFVQNNPSFVGKVVDYATNIDRVYQLDISANNASLAAIDFTDSTALSNWLNQQLTGYTYGIGGYMESRAWYARSPLFQQAEEPRTLHLGVDIWAEPGTPVYSPLTGVVHSFNNNNNFGDYGPTVIIEHNLDGLTVFSLYGHLSHQSLEGLYAGMPVQMNQQIGEFGQPFENGNWPPHVHFQLMFDMQGHSGDFPGVGKLSEQAQLKANIPDPNIILGF